MIVREIVKNSEIINNFDWFNDYTDTINWLECSSQNQSDLIQKMKAAYIIWKNNRIAEYNRKNLK